MTKVVAFRGRDFHRLFGTVILKLQIAGCYMGDDLSAYNKNSGKLSKMTKINLTKLYCTLMILCVSFYSSLLVYKLVVLEPLSSDWMKIFALSALSSGTTVNMIVTMVKQRNNQLSAWFQNFEFYDTIYGLNDKFYGLSKKLRYAQIMAIVSVISFCVGVTVSTFSVPEIKRIIMFESVPGILSNSLQIVSWSGMALFIGGFISYIILGSTLISFEFETVNKKLKSSLSFSDDTRQHLEIQSKLERHTRPDIDELSLRTLHKQHNNVCALLSEFNGCISHFLLINFFVMLPLACLIFYFILMKMESAGDVLFGSLAIVLVFLHLILLCLFGSRINIKAHEPLQYLWAVSLSHVSEKTARELIMFANKLTGPPIGYSVYGLFTITLPESLSIAGTLLTYLVVILQFLPSSREPSGPNLDQDELSYLTSLLQNVTRLIG